MSEKDSIPIPKKLIEKFWPYILAALVGTGTWQGHSMVTGSTDTRLAVVENQVGYLEKSFDKIDKKLDELSDKLDGR